MYECDMNTPRGNQSPHEAQWFVTRLTPVGEQVTLMCHDHLRWDHDAWDTKVLAAMPIKQDPQNNFSEN